MKHLANLLPRVWGPGGLRFILASMVVVTHATTVKCGHLAVCVFFVLSGYWIAVVWNNEYSRISYSTINFYLSRYWRLIPVLLASFALVLFSVHVLGVSSMPPYLRVAQIEIWQIGALFTILGLSGGSAIIGPTWSLDIEMQFYLLFPILAWLGIGYNKIKTTVFFGGLMVFHVINLVFNICPRTIVFHS